MDKGSKFCSHPGMYFFPQIHQLGCADFLSLHGSCFKSVETYPPLLAHSQFNLSLFIKINIFANCVLWCRRGSCPQKCFSLCPMQKARFLSGSANLFSSHGSHVASALLPENLIWSYIFLPPTSYSIVFKFNFTQLLRHRQNEQSKILTQNITGRVSIPISNGDFAPLQTLMRQPPTVCSSPNILLLGSHQNSLLSCLQNSVTFITQSCKLFYIPATETFPGLRITCLG